METNLKTRVGVLGYGEVGSAIAAFYDDPAIHDITKGSQFPDNLQLDILHVCIPYSPGFHDVVKTAIAKWAEGGLVIIHSTVPVGTTEKIAEYHKMVVHSPVRGVHPKLKEGIETFIKFIGADFAGAGRLASEHFNTIGIQAFVMHKSKTTEMLKLLDTTYYGLAIAYHAYAAKLCEKEGLNFDMVMTLANDSYNEGYTKLGKTNVIRPVLHAPDGGKIGGHCVIPNAALLREQFGDDLILQSILRHK